MPGVPPTSSSRDNFSLSSTDNEFRSRTNDVFSSLDSIERQHASHERSLSDYSHERSRSPDELASETSRQRNHHSRRHHTVGNRTRPREQVDDRHTGFGPFRRPSNRPLRRSYIPDFRRNPQNYTAYDLSTVADHTERSNTSAALSFLDDLRKRRENSESSEWKTQSDYEINSSKSGVWGTASKYVRRKHTFTRGSDHIVDEPQPSTSGSSEETVKDTNSAGNARAKYVSGKLTMPEYVTGREKVNRRERNDSKTGGLTCDALSLDHLTEESSSKDDDANVIKISHELASNPVKTEICDNSSEKEKEKVQFKKVKRKAGMRKRNSDE